MKNGAHSFTMFIETGPFSNLRHRLAHAALLRARCAISAPKAKPYSA